MPRCHIYHKPTGTLLARDLYRHWQPWLLDHHDSRDVLPYGAFFEEEASDQPLEGCLLLGSEGLMKLMRDPETENRMIRYFLAQDEETRVAWERVECHLSYFICVAAGEWELEQVADDSGECWVAWVQHQGRHQLLRVAYGRDEAEAKKRLIPAAQERLKQEAGLGSQPGQILGLSIEIESLESFARSMGFDPNADEAEVTWLSRRWF